MSIQVVQARCLDSLPSGSHALTEIRCFPDSKSSFAGLFPVIPCTKPTGFGGNGISKSFVRCFTPAEMSYATNSSTHTVFTVAEHAGVFVKS